MSLCVVMNDNNMSVTVSEYSLSGTSNDSTLLKNGFDMLTIKEPNPKITRVDGNYTQLKIKKTQKSTSTNAVTDKTVAGAGTKTARTTDADSASSTKSSAAKKSKKPVTKKSKPTDSKSKTEKAGTTKETTTKKSVASKGSKTKKTSPKKTDVEPATKPQNTLEDELAKTLTPDEIKNFQIERVDMDKLTHRVCELLIECETDGMLQTDLYKKLKLSARNGARLSLKLERMGTVSRVKILENERWTYKLILKKTPVSTDSLNGAPCLTCAVEQRCSIDGEISPTTCPYIEDWVLVDLKRSRSK